MDTSTQTLIRLIQSAEVKKNILEEAQRLADLEARGVKATAEALNMESQ